MPENEDVQDAVQVPSGDDQLEFNLGEGEQGAEVEIAEDGTAKIAAVDEEEAKNAASEGKKTPDRGTQEHEEYSNKVKKRIEKMTAKLRESERREQAALEYAKQVQANLQQMQAKVYNLDQGYLTESKGRIDSQISIAEANLQNAVEQNDGRAVVEAQKLLSQLMIQQDQLNRVAAQRPKVQPQAPQQAYQQPVYQQPSQQAQRGPDEKAEQWAEENEWFGSDEVMTNGTFAIHNQLEREGFDLSSDEYYDELNRRIRK
jgi:predicted ribosome quality control (RQC) complex YloA/Tae2 family protein